jgi:maleate isomerase
MNTRAVAADGVTMRSFPSLSDGGPTRHGAIGLVALATDHVCELDLRQIIPQDRLPLYVGRIGFAPEITVATLGAMRDGITAAASLILAGGRLDVLAYGCTSGTMVIGEDEVFARLRAARPGIACTSPPTAALAALQALGLRRIAVLTPYTEDVNRRVVEYFTARGLDIAAFGAFDKGSDAEIAAIAPASIVEAALGVGARHRGDLPLLHRAARRHGGRGDRGQARQAYRHQQPGDGLACHAPRREYRSGPRLRAAAASLTQGPLILTICGTISSTAVNDGFALAKVRPVAPAMITRSSSVMTR